MKKEFHCSAFPNTLQWNFFVLVRWKVAFVLMRRLRFLIQLFYWHFIGVFYCIMFEMLKNYLRKKDFC